MKIDEKLIDPISRVFEVDPNTKNDKPNRWMSAILSMVLSLYGELHRQGQSMSCQVKKRWDNWSCRVKFFEIFVFWRIDVFFLYNVSLIIMIFTWSINEERVLSCAPVNVWPWLNVYDVYGNILGKPYHEYYLANFLGKPYHEL